MPVHSTFVSIGEDRLLMTVQCAGVIHTRTTPTATSQRSSDEIWRNSLICRQFLDGYGYDMANQAFVGYSGEHRGGEVGSADLLRAL